MPDAACADAGDPPPCQIVNAAGAAPILLVCDHASRALPAAYGRLGLDEAELWRHIAWDIGAADVAGRLARLLDATAVLSGCSRLLVDCNRAADDPTLICRVSDGTVVPGNRALDETEVARRIRLYHEPYHAAVAGELARLAARGAAPALISIHSFTPVMKGLARPWHVGILWDRDGRIPLPLLRVLGEDPTLVVGDNEPYSGRGNVGYTTRRHAEPAGLPHVLIEIRQDLIDTHHGAEAWANRLAAALRQVLAGLAASEPAP
jgi:predicted N-formylglutamate amidohydrolase